MNYPDVNLRDITLESNGVHFTHCNPLTVEERPKNKIVDIILPVYL